MVCLLGREGKCETAVWDVCGDTRECVFFISPILPVYCACTVIDMSLV